jgi:Ca2+-binding EF-hand superfamily protein
MFKKFGKLDKSEKGYVATQDLNAVCDFKPDSIGQAVSENLASGFGDQIDFRNLIKNLSAFHNSDEDAKLKCKIFFLKTQSLILPAGF